MMEQVPVIETEKKPSISIENAAELPNHLDVSRLMKEKGAFFVHTIQMRNDFDISENNKSLDIKKLSAADKLDILYGTNPTLSASTIRPNTGDSLYHNGFGVIFSHGEIEHAGTNDQGTVALSHGERHVIGGANKEKADIDRAIDRPIEGGGYNEIVLKSPEVAGGFMNIKGFQDRISYESEEAEYYDGEKIVTNIGTIDFSNPLDRFGRPTGANYDKPFSVLVEMSKRGKVFVMDESNQMHIVESIDEANRKVRFLDSPIDPKTFAESYGAERMNKYTKKEMKDRLEESLKKKEMELR